MKVKFNHFLIIILFCCITINNSYAQLDTIDFKNRFKMVSIEEKIALLASKRFDIVIKIYPNLVQIVNVYKPQLNKPISKKTNFEINKITLGYYLKNKQFKYVVKLSNYTLANYAQNVDDSIVCLFYLKSAYLKLFDLKNTLIKYEILANLWPRKSKGNDCYYGQRKSSIFLNVGLYKEALKACKDEYYVFESLASDTILKSVSYNNEMGVIYNKLNQPDSALYYFNKAIKFFDEKISSAQKKKYAFWYTFLNGNKGVSYFLKKEYQKALTLILNDARVSLKEKYIESAFNSFVYAAKCKIYLNDLVSAKIYLDSAEYCLNKNINNKYVTTRYFETLTDYFVKNKSYEAAYNTMLKYGKFNTSEFSIENINSILSAEIAYTRENNENELAKKSLLLKQSLSNTEKIKNLIAFLILGIISIIFIVLYLIERNYNSKKRQVELEVKNKKIVKSLKEKEILLKEIHHRVKNNLQLISSMINLQRDKIQDHKVLSILDDTKQRISAIAETHTLLYKNSDLAYIDIKDFIENLVTIIENTFATKHIKVIRNYKSNNTKINIDTAVPLGLIVNEIVTNCYKHAFANTTIEGVIQINLDTEQNKNKLTIKDNGIGFLTDFDINKSKSLGMELIQILSDQINAKLVIQNENGAKVSLLLN